MDIPHELNLVLPPEIAAQLKSMKCKDAAEEIRLRIGQAASVVTSSGTIHSAGKPVAKEHLDHILERASGSSMHTSADMLRNGYLYAASGCRIGFCGTVLSGGAGLRAITSVNIRIPHEMKGCAESLAQKVMEEGSPNTLILSPPGYGKTTLLRDLIRCLSRRGIRVCAADERGEISGTQDRIRSFDLGPNTDVMIGGRKSETAMMLLRAMSPQILAFDEITSPDDLAVIEEATGCGVALLATAHARCRADLERRLLYAAMLTKRIFTHAIWIDMTGGRRSYTLERL